MDILHYFHPVNFSLHNRISGWKYTLGFSVEKVTLEFTKGRQKPDVVVFGVPYNHEVQGSDSLTTPGKIRKELYLLSHPGRDLKVADLGDLKISGTKKGIHLAVRDITEYFHTIGIRIVVLGGSQELTVGICNAFRSLPLFSLACADAILDVTKGREKADSSNFLSGIFSSHSNLFRFSLIGYQGHYFSPKLFEKAKGLGRHLRLGVLRESILQAEPVLRDCDVFSFDIGVVKSSDSPGHREVRPNGLRSEEACQLARYAGLGGNLKVFGLFEVCPEKDHSEMTLKLSAQLIWYFLEGCSAASGEKPGDTECMVTYRVEVSHVDQPLVFYQSRETLRWWMEISSVNGGKITVPCTEAEYRQAAANEIPGLWLEYVQKTDDLSK